MSDRPRRSTRQTRAPNSPLTVGSSASSITTTDSPSKPGPKRRAQTTDPEQWLRSLLQNPKSILTTIDISEVFNVVAWNMLSDESRSELKKLLPRTAFAGYKPLPGQDHPASLDSDSMDVDESNNELASRDSGSLMMDVEEAALFSDPHFLSAARTFQDHLYSNWFSDAHQAKVAKFETDLQNGTLAVQWKDEQWLEENPAFNNSAPAGLATTEDLGSTNPSSLGRTGSLRTLAGGASQVKFTTLVERGIIRVGDILAYRRAFTLSNLTIEKDVIVDSIHPSTHALTVLVGIGTGRALPGDLLGPDSNLNSNSDSTTNSIRSMSTITSPTMLETGILDVDGRLDRSQRPNGNAWKSISVWRWRVPIDTINPDNDRGGRENHGTLFYLRGNYYHEEF